MNSVSTPPANKQKDLSNKFRICLDRKVCRPALYQEKPPAGVKCREGLVISSSGDCKTPGEDEAVVYNPAISFQFDKEGCNIKANPTDFTTKLKRIRAFEWMLDAATLGDCHIAKVTALATISQITVKLLVTFSFGNQMSDYHRYIPF